MKKICLFNHKGGVSKTTTAFNLGWAMADMGKKILLIDCDSQCNLTGLILGYGNIDDDNMDKFYSNPKNLTMQDVVDATIQGVLPDSFMSTITIKDLYKTQNNNLFLLSGYLSISELDTQLGLSLKISSGVPAVKNLPSNFITLIDKIAERENIDYIVYDLSPSIGSLNTILLMSSDYFIVPTAPDFFSLQAILSLSKNIKNWKNEIEKFKKDNNFDDSYVIKNNPKFMGNVQQRYRLRNNNPAKSYGEWIDKIRDTINDVLVPVLSNMNCIVSREKFISVIKDKQPFDLAYIPDFNSLIAISHNLSKPVFALTDSDIGRSGYVQKTMTENRNEFKRLFETMAANVIDIVD